MVSAAANGKIVQRVWNIETNCPEAPLEKTEVSIDNPVSDLLSLIRAQFCVTCERAVIYGGVYFPFFYCTKTEAEVNLKQVIGQYLDCVRLSYLLCMTKVKHSISLSI